ncbi:MAG: LysM peptidoglycan-binding domain-containing protein [Cellvibrionaceae bacterium]|nr:LysM peptidoglycan-binding domain-containing protein [Cellvibrionaceae bacterium]MCV6626975.1 LysM peptidoglycan-binding domain-containing protein [Cellvibrionaceae bacterium]
MKKILLAAMVSLLALGLSLKGHADEPRLKSSHPDTYTVVKGDTLWDISGRFLENPWMWPEIWQVNTQIANPHLIFPGDRISLIYMDGKPRLTVDRGEAGRTYKAKLGPKVHIVPKEEAINTIPLDRINAFLSRSRVVEVATLDKAPYVLAGGDEHIITGAGDSIFGRGEFEKGVIIYGVYRKGDAYVDPISKEPLGIQAIDIATVKQTALEKDIGTFEVVRTTQEVRLGDRFLKTVQRSIDSTFFPSAPAKKIDAQIIGVEGGVNQVSKLDVVAINRGEREELQVGDVLLIYKKGDTVRDRVTNEVVQLPPVRSGVVMVFSVFEKMSYGIVLEAERALRTGDFLRSP